MRFITQRNHCDSAVPGGSRESGLDQLCGVGSYVCMYVSTYTAGKHIRPDPCPLPGKNTFDAFNYCTVGSVAFRGRGMYDTFSKRQLASSVAPPWEENRSLNQRRISGMCIACTGRLGPGGGGPACFLCFPWAVIDTVHVHHVYKYWITTGPFSSRACISRPGVSRSAHPFPVLPVVNRPVPF